MFSFILDCFIFGTCIEDGLLSLEERNGIFSGIVKRSLDNVLPVVIQSGRKEISFSRSKGSQAVNLSILIDVEHVALQNFISFVKD